MLQVRTEASSISLARLVASWTLPSLEAGWALEMGGASGDTLTAIHRQGLAIPCSDAFLIRLGIGKIKGIPARRRKPLAVVGRASSPLIAPTP